MAAKRKVAGAKEAAPKKKPRTETQPSSDASDVEIDAVSDSFENHVINFTTTGEKRADSEARRAWNYVCDFEGCGQRFNRPCRLEAHKRTHNKERPFSCPYDDCDKTFSRKDHLQRHLTHFHAAPERNHPCDWEGCGKSFTSHGRLQRHKEVHESKFYCTGYPPCNEAFRKQKTLDAHIKTVHMEMKAYPCTFVDAETGEKCTHGYQTENGLRRHVVKAHNEKEEHHFFCMSCPAPGTECETFEGPDGETITIVKEPLSFATAIQLTAHDAEVHPPTCSVCGQVFRQQSTLNSHFKALHMGPQNQELFPCPYQECGKVFNRKSNLNAHVTQVHENQYRFACTTEAMQNSKHPDLSGWNGENACGKQVKTKSALEQHIRTHHLGLQNRKATRKLAKPRKRLIPDPSALTLLTGVGYEEGRPITCLLDDCPNRFARDRDLKRHMVAEHGCTDTDVEVAILERDAANGGQFWIGGLDDFDPMSISGSTDPSLPHTPMPYFGDQAMEMEGGFGKLDEGPLDPSLMDANMFDFGDVEMDWAGFADGDVPQNNFQMGLLGPVQQYNAHMQG